MMLLLLFFFVTTGLVQCESTKSDSDTCAADSSFDTKLKGCVKLALNLVTNYLEDPDYIFCSNFSKVSSCFLELNCNRRVKQEINWWPAVELYAQQKCDVNSSSVKVNETCFEKQFYTTYSFHCAGYYTPLDRKANCNELLNAVECLVKLVESDCGEQDASFARALHTAYRWQELQQQFCFQQTAQLDNNMFEYSTDCPANLEKKLVKCQRKFLPNVEFREDQDFIMEKSEDSLKKKCRRVAKYSNCVAKFRKNCPKGVEYFYQGEPMVNAYVGKMEYICHHTVTSTYLENLNCLHNVHDSNVLSVSCAHAIQQYDRQRNNAGITLSNFYCSGSSDVQQLKEFGSALRSCFGSVYKRECGEVIADIMDDFYLVSFNSPHHMFGRDLYEDYHFPYVPYCNGRNYDKNWSDDLYTGHFSKYTNSFLAKPLTRGTGEHVYEAYFVKAALHGPFYYDPTTEHGLKLGSENQSVVGTNVSRTQRTERGSEVQQSTDLLDATDQSITEANNDQTITKELSNGTSHNSNRSVYHLGIYLVAMFLLSHCR